MEEFRVFPEYPEYEVSSEGYLRRRLPGRGTYVGRIVKGAIRPDGYLGVFRMKPFNMMHQIVAHVFHGPCPEGMWPNHKNRVRSDCRKDNLEYLTYAENAAHGFHTASEEEKQRRRATWRQNQANKDRSKGGRYLRTEETRAKLSAITKAWWEHKRSGSACRN